METNYVEFAKKTNFQPVRVDDSPAASHEQEYSPLHFQDTRNRFENVYPSNFMHGSHENKQRRPRLRRRVSSSSTSSSSSSASSWTSESSSSSSSSSHGYHRSHKKSRRHRRSSSRHERKHSKKRKKKKREKRKKKYKPRNSVSKKSSRKRTSGDNNNEWYSAHNHERNQKYLSKKYRYDNAAVIIQKQSRGYLARKYKFRNLSKPLVDILTGQILEQIIEDLLLGEIVPDLLIDIITAKEGEYDPLSVEEQICYEYAHNILNCVIRTEAEGVVKQYFKEWVAVYLEKKDIRNRHDPMIMVLNDFLDSTIKSFLINIVSEAVKELVKDYMLKNRFEEFFNFLLDPLVRETISETLTEVSIEEAAEEIEISVVSKICNEVVTETIQKNLEIFEQNRKANTLNEISELAQRIIERSALQLLLSVVASNGESIAVRETFNQLLNVQMAKMLTEKVQNEFLIQNTFSRNRILRHYHQVFTGNALSRVFLRMLEEELMHEEDRIHLEESSQR